MLGHLVIILIGAIFYPCAAQQSPSESINQNRFDVSVKLKKYHDESEMIEKNLISARDRWEYEQKIFEDKMAAMLHTVIEHKALGRTFDQPKKELVKMMIKQHDNELATHWNEIEKLEKKVQNLMKLSHDLSIASQHKEDHLLELVEKARNVKLSKPVFLEEIAPHATDAVSVAMDWNLEQLCAPLMQFNERIQKSFLGAITIEGVENEPIFSLADGKVVFADRLTGLGYTIIIEHGDNYVSVYANCASILKNINDIARAGEVIARVGHSGLIGADALYFEFRQFDRTLALPLVRDPTNYF